MRATKSGPTVRDLMIAVALTPLVLFAVIKATEVWGTSWVILSKETTVHAGPGRVLVHTTMTRSEISPWPGPVAGLVASMTLGAAWWGLARMLDSRKLRSTAFETNRADP